MNELQIGPIANQTFTATLDGSSYEITLKATGTCMCADVAKDGTLLVQGQRLVCGSFFIPYNYLQGGGGNFTIITQNDDLPDWGQFGITQFLVYLSAEEMVEYVL